MASQHPSNVLMAIYHHEHVVHRRVASSSTRNLFTKAGRAVNHHLTDMSDMVVPIADQIRHTEDPKEEASDV